GVGNRWHAGVGHQKHKGSAEGVGDQSVGPRALVVVVERHEATANRDSEPASKVQRAPRVLRRHHVSGGKRVLEAVGRVGEIADGRTREDNAAVHVASVAHAPVRLSHVLNTVSARGAAPWEWLWRWRVAVMVSGVGALAWVLRFVGLNKPYALVFDEVFYVRGAYSMLKYGYEGDWTGDNKWFEQGNLSGLHTTGDFIVHPMVGKLLIALGMKTFGNNPFGWRVTTALAGVATCIIVALIARHLFRSTLWGGVAGVLVAIDGMSIV